MKLVVLLGGARSGKSSLAVELARSWSGPVTVLATAEPRDEEMAERIRLHRAERPEEWSTVEEPLALGASVESVAEDAALIVDCLSLWVANVLERGATDEEIEHEAAAAAAGAAGRSALTIAVTNEVGLGIVPIEPIARRYRDVLGRVNAAWVEAADRAGFVVAGRVLPLERSDVLTT